MSNTIRIGILGCSKAASSAVINPSKEIKHAELYAVASRDFNRAKTYADKYGIPRFFNSYQEMLMCREVDLVYIGLPNSMHAEWIVKAADANKHILVEKPMCLNMDEMNEIEYTCKKNRVLLLEGIMTQHHPWQEKIKNIIDEGKYGKLKRARTQISYQLDRGETGNYRCCQSLGGGAFYDESAYWLQFIQYIMGMNPLSFDGQSLFDGPDHCDWTFRSHMNFCNGIKTEFIASFEMPYESTHWLEFECANVRISNFFRASMGNYKMNIDIDDLDGVKKERIVFASQNYYTNQMDFFVKVIRGNIQNMDILQSAERIDLMSKIYQAAKAKQRR